jgi:uncharacterized protein (TIGR03437 family)
VWTFSVSLADYANNSRGLSASELAMLGPTQLTVVSAAPINITASPQSLVFNCLTGQLCTQNMLVTAATGTGTVYSISIDTSVGKWLTVSSSSGKIPSTVTVSANTSGLIAPGIYHGTLTITAPGALLATVPVTLNVNTGSTLNIAVPDPYWSPRFIYQTTGPPPSPQRVTVSGQHYDAAAYQWKDQTLAVTAEVVINGGSQNTGWLSVTPASASTPVSFAVTVNPLGLAPGVYNGSIKLTAPAADNSPLFMPVTLTVNQSAITAVLNGADFSRYVSPGSIATIFGQLLASTSQQAASVPLPLNLSGVSLKINPSTDSHGNWVGGMAAPLWYAGPDQINFEMPTDVPLGGTNAVLTTTSASGVVTILWFTFQVQGTSLTIFTYGNNRAVATRPDNSLVDINHPARPGSMLTAYITGIGPLDNPVATNVTTPNQPLSRPGSPGRAFACPPCSASSSLCHTVNRT